MPLTPTAERISSRTVKYTWSGDAPYDVWLDGTKVLSASDATQYIAQTTDGTTNPLPAIEVRDDNDSGLAQSEQYAPTFRLQWRGQTDAAIYIIQEYVSDNWTTRATAIETGAGYYNYTTRALPDNTSANWRVVPRDVNGYEGDPVYFTHTVVCNPAPPAVTFSYSGGNITAASA